MNIENKLVEVLPDLDIATLNIDINELLSKLDQRIVDEYYLNQELYDDFGDINLVSKLNNKQSIFIYRDKETNQISVTVGAAGVRDYFDNIDAIADFINTSMRNHYEEIDSLNEDNWDEQAQRVEDTFKKAYAQYVESNPENHLDYNDWFNILPMTDKERLYKLAGIE